MTVSKRTRFEVLRRDNHTCRYCHATDSPLTVDHVTPVALGGSDKPDNLAAACKDCNAGKSSAAPDGTLVAEVAEDALRHAEMIRQAYAVVVERMGERDDYIEEFDEAYTYEPMPANWRESVGRWFEMGVPIELVVDAARKACSIPRRFSGDGRFKYMCGIVWNQVHAVNEAVELKVAILGAFMTDSDLTDQRIASYEQGCDFGEEVGQRRAKLSWGKSDSGNRLLLNVVERTYQNHREAYERNIGQQIAALRQFEPGEDLEVRT